MGSIHDLKPDLIRTMCFIDGYYLRKNTLDLFNNKNIDFEKLHCKIAEIMKEGLLFPQFVRIFYYDAIVDPTKATQEDYLNQKAYFDTINSLDFYEVKLGELIQLEDGKMRQKGVDVFLSIDMVKKAYENHYEWAVLIAGDGDYVETVKAVKDTGKRVYGCYFDQHTSQNLKAALDKGFVLDKHTGLIEILKTAKYSA